MPLDLEEQEQLAELKAWWKQNGPLLLALACAVAIALAGWQGWRWYQRSQALQAGALYETLVKAALANDGKAVRDAAGALIEGYPRTRYASMGALVAARYLFDRGDLKNAKAQLQWALEHAPADELRDLARLRLASVLVDEKSFDEAMALAEGAPSEPFAAQFAALKGDILVARNRGADARAAYRAALEKADAKNEAFRNSVQMRLDALGG